MRVKEFLGLLLAQGALRRLSRDFFVSQGRFHLKWGQVHISSLCPSPCPAALCRCLGKTSKLGGVGWGWGVQCYAHSLATSP